MVPLHTYYLRALRSSRAEFVAQHPEAFLVRPPGTDEAPAVLADDDDVPTQLVDVAGPAAVRATGPDGPPDEDGDAAGASAREWMVAVIAKRAAGYAPYNRIFVGRSSVNDVAFNVPSVSKLHAQFHLVRQRVAHLSDRRSANGTFHRGRRLEPDEVVELEPRDALAFGTLEVQFLDAAALYDFLHEERVWSAAPAAPAADDDDE